MNDVTGPCQPVASLPTSKGLHQVGPLQVQKHFGKVGTGRPSDPGQARQGLEFLARPIQLRHGAEGVAGG